MDIDPFSMPAPPPVPIERECAVVNALSIMASCRETIFETLRLDDFGHPPARQAFEYLKHAWEGKVSLDDQAVVSEFLTRFGDVVGRSDSTHHAVAMREVYDAATRRRAWIKILALQELAVKADTPLESIRDANAEVLEFLTHRTGLDQGVRTIEEILKSQLDLVDRARAGDSVVVPFGLPTLEEWELLRPGTMTLIAGRPGSGKTALMCTCLNAQGALGLRPACYCAEMTDEEITMRMVAQLAGISFSKIIGGLADVTPSQLAAYQQAHATIRKAQPTLSCGKRMTIRDFETFATYSVRERGAKIVWLDYIQKLVPLNPKMDMRLHIGECSGRIKVLSQKLAVPIIPLAQFNREAEDCQPRVSHLKEAGALEEDADGIILLDRPYARPNPSPRKYTVFRKDRLYADWVQVEMDWLEDKLVMIVSKNRNGPCGINYAGFNGPLMALNEASWPWSVT